MKVKGCSSSYLPDSCNRNAGISDSLQTKTRISILAQSFNPASAQPLPSLSTSNMVACTKAKTNCTRDLEKSVEASYIWLDSCVRQGGAFTNGLPFYQRANWPREMSFLSQGQGYPAFVANFTIRQKRVSLFGFSFQLETTLQHIFSTKCPLESKTCQIHANQSLMLLKTCCCEQTDKSYKFQNKFWKTWKWD